MRAYRYNSLPQLAAVMAGFALTLLLFESEALLQWARRQQVSQPANIAVQATTYLDRLAQPLRVGWLRREALIDLDRLGWTDDPARLQSAQRAFASAGPPHIQPCAAAPDHANRPASGGLIADLPHAARIPVPPDTPKITSLPQLPAAPKGQPRVVALAGDSMMAVGLSDILLRQTASDPNVRVIKAFRSGTGLARPDVFDWIEEYPAMIGTQNPDAVIVAIGANDGQGIVEDGKALAFGSDAWIEVYQRRVAEFLNLLTQDGAQVVWVGLPPMKSAQYNQKAAEINRIAYSVVSHAPHATWWNPQAYIADPSGAYRDFETTPDGRTTRLRQPDGIHFSDEGAMLISPPLIDWLNASGPAPAIAQTIVRVIPRKRVRKALTRKRRL